MVDPSKVCGYFGCSLDFFDHLTRCAQAVTFLSDNTTDKALAHAIADDCSAESPHFELTTST